MNRRAFVFKGKENGYSIDKELKNLPYLDNDTKAIIEALEDDWIVDKTPTTLNKSTDISNALKECTEDTILFYFTGHGVEVEGVFKLVGVENENIDLLSELNNIHEKHLAHKTVILVLDACHSNVLIEKLHNDYKYEVLVAVKAGIAYDDEVHQKGFFTHHFCEYLKDHREQENFLHSIGCYIERQKNSNTLRINKPKYHLKYSLDGRTKTYITQSKLIKKTKGKIKKAYPKFEDLQNEIFSYIKNTSSSPFKKTEKATIYNDLLGVLLNKDNKNILDCILKISDNCKKLKEEIEKSRLVKSVILIIKSNENGENDKCSISGWIEDSIGKYTPVEYSNGINFNNNEYKKSFPSTLAKMIGIRELGSFCELKLILDSNLLKKDFGSLDISLHDIYDTQNKIKYLFKVTIKIELRHELLKTNILQKWKDNSDIFINYSEQQIKNHIYDDKEFNDFSKSCAKFENSNAQEGEKFPYIAMTTKNTMLDKSDIRKIMQKSIPILICHQKKIDSIIGIDWKKTKVKNMKITAFNFFLGHEEDIHFIHDTYDEALKLKALYINKDDHKPKYDYLGD